MLLQQIYRHKLNKYRALIDKELETVVASEREPSVREMLRYALKDGRRFRPLLFLLCYKVLGTELDSRAYGLAGAIELLHKASLLHDDLIDHDDFRRGKPTFHARFGMAKTVILGDLLVGEASLRFCRATDFNLSQLWLEQYRTLCYGELLDVLEDRSLPNTDAVESIVYGKTASFLEFVFRAGSIAAGGDSQQEKHLAYFGKHVGFMFQIINDWNNWRGFEEQLGRCVGSDLSQGKLNHISLFVKESEATRQEVEDHVKALVEEHAGLARTAISRLGLENNYVALLAKMLEDKYASWYWVDADSE